MTRTIGILVFPDFQLLDAAGPITAFELANRETDSSAYRLCLFAIGAETNLARGQVGFALYPAS